MSDKELYEFTIGDDGLDYDILDKAFNPATQQFLLKNGLKPGLKVLDVGCGAGVMTAWMASIVGKSGRVTAIDNSAEQLSVAQRKIEGLGLKNVSTQVLSAYDIGQVNQQYDLIYCRFLLHHLHKPRQAIQAFHDTLKPGGLYIGEEGIISAMFSYPQSFAWQGYTPELSEIKEHEGEKRDGDFGLKLFHACKKMGFSIGDCALQQPIFWTQEQKQGLLEGLLAFKETELAHGMSEQDWQRKYEETQRLIDDDEQLIGFYGSCQVAAQKAQTT